jgi:hypothetical protein
VLSVWSSDLRDMYHVFLVTDDRAERNAMIPDLSRQDLIDSELDMPSFIADDGCVRGGLIRGSPAHAMHGGPQWMRIRPKPAIAAC